MKLDEAIKWLGTTVLIIGTGVNGLNIYPLGAMILTVGGWIWLTAAIRARDWPLIITNLIMSMTGMAGIIYNLWFVNP
jgi:hypothetical protein